MQNLAILIIACALFLFSQAMAQPPKMTMEESLELRKISEYWKEKDWGIVKVQVQEFLTKYPTSPYCDQMHAMLGDVLFNEKNYADACLAYTKIEDKQLQIQTHFHYLHCLYELGRYETFREQSKSFLNDPNAKPEEIHAVRFELGQAYFSQAEKLEGEEKRRELQKALENYNYVLRTKYEDLALLPMAQIHAELKEYVEASSLFVRFAQKESEKKEDYLFQAASLLLNVDKKEAANLFGEIAALEGKHASKAAFNQLSLLFSEKDYAHFILAQEKVMKYIAQEKIPLMHYYLGKSLFHTRDFTHAIEPLSMSLSSHALESMQEKSALMTLAFCAKETQDLALFETVLRHLQAEFAEENEIPNLLLMYAQLLREQKKPLEAREAMAAVLRMSPDHPQAEALMFDQALLFLEEGKNSEAAKSFEKFIAQFPHSFQKPNALRHLLNIRIDDLQTASHQTQKAKHGELVKTLAIALKEENSFSTQERQKMRFLFARMLFELEEYDDASHELSFYVQDFSNDLTAADAYLLLAHCHRKLHDDIQFALNAEKALKLNPEIAGAADLRIKLFNIYLSRLEHEETEDKADIMKKAAEHLFFAVEKPLQKENLLWLAEYYCHNNPIEERAICVLEKIVADETPLWEKEAEAVKLSELYAKTHQFNERLQLLETLYKEQKSQPERNWKYPRKVQFEVASAYQNMGEKQKAVATYADLIASSTHLNSYYAIAAELEKAKLDFLLLSDEEKREDSKKFLAICDALKEVEAKRKLHSEPLHLEAGLLYIEIKTQWTSPDKKDTRKLFLLKQMKERFSSSEDLLVAEYLKAADQFPEKKRLYDQYLDYLDAEMTLLNAKQTQDAHLADEAKDKFTQLMAESTNDTLTQRILKSMENGL